MIEWILRRRSIRKFKAEAIGEAKLQAILDAAMSAPTANNTRLWDIVVVRDQAQKQAIADAHPWGKMAPAADVVIVLVGDPTNKYMEQEAGATTQNILLAASSLGLGAVWLGLKDPEREAGVRRALEIPASRIPLVAIPIGVPDEEKPARTQFDAGKVHLDRYGRV